MSKCLQSKIAQRSVKQSMSWSDRSCLPVNLVVCLLSIDDSLLPPIFKTVVSVQMQEKYCPLCFNVFLNITSNYIISLTGAISSHSSLLQKMQNVVSARLLESKTKCTVFV